MSSRFRIGYSNDLSARSFCQSNDWYSTQAQEQEDAFPDDIAQVQEREVAFPYDIDFSHLVASIVDDNTGVTASEEPPKMIRFGHLLESFCPKQAGPTVSAVRERRQGETRQRLSRMRLRYAGTPTILHGEQEQPPNVDSVKAHDDSIGAPISDCVHSVWLRIAASGSGEWRLWP